MAGGGGTVSIEAFNELSDDLTLVVDVSQTHAKNLATIDLKEQLK